MCEATWREGANGLEVTRLDCGGKGEGNILVCNGTDGADERNFGSMGGTLVGGAICGCG